ncbi:WG repeat-containing protein [Chryseolinea lacunae]|uniref:WG repeat-containing protein n=1 Tax=Chryseolinea lacunae TaxID=2801331 RepID=A0ABS1KTM7_9BACT|nr:WG repeat-containing protein [Chryseolinea lacunae]MBL0742057.1 WG repeat-containing protein [Chryseolinea lacunae]
MRIVCIPLLFMAITSACCQSLQETKHPDDTSRFRVSIDRHWGFINRHGELVVKPIFKNAGDFSEGLCAVRIDGCFGFIDKNGTFVIAPSFDFATQFKEGLAIVFLRGKSFYIDRDGKRAFDNIYKHVSDFGNGRAYVRTFTGKEGVIDQHGKLLIDTMFSGIGSFSEGCAVVRGLRQKSHEDEDLNVEVGLIDAEGKFMVPYNRYSNIVNSSKGYFEVSGIDDDDKARRSGLIDSNGAEVFIRADTGEVWLAGGLCDGLARIHLYNYKADAITDSHKDNAYEGFVNDRGELVVDNPEFKNVSDFSSGRAFVEELDGHYSVINTQGKRIGSVKFNNVLSTSYNVGSFQDGIAFVSTDDGWGMIDTSTNFLIKPRFQKIESPGLVGNYFFFEGGNPQASDMDATFYGVADRGGNVIFNSVMQTYDQTGFVNGLLKYMVDNKLTFVNTDGKIVWQETPLKDGKITALNIDYMNRGYCYAQSQPNEADNGHGYSDSMAEAARIKNRKGAPANVLSITIVDNDAVFENQFKGMVVQIANQSKRTVLFNAQDNRLDMKMQALDHNGVWQDIEYLPNSWCGNSYHTLRLKRSRSWSLVLPRYEGDIKTKLRVSLQYIDPRAAAPSAFSRAKETLVIYSPEFEGSVNPAQFWRRPEYYRGGIMDPYNE